MRGTSRRGPVRTNRTCVGEQLDRLDAAASAPRRISLHLKVAGALEDAVVVVDDDICASARR